MGMWEAGDVVPIVILSLSGDAVATVQALPEDTGRSFALKVAAATGHSRFSLVTPGATAGMLSQDAATPLLRVFADVGIKLTAAELDTTPITLTILAKEVRILRLSGIPSDATFGGHGGAVGNTPEAALGELNGDWHPVPLLEVRGLPVWRKETRLQNLGQDWQPMAGDDGVRYAALAEDGVINISYFEPGEEVEEPSFEAGKWANRHGFICPVTGVPYLQVMGEGWKNAMVFLALKQSQSFPTVQAYGPGWGRNVHAGHASLITAAAMPDV